jgi:hypothetical protein
MKDINRLCDQNTDFLYLKAAYIVTCIAIARQRLGKYIPAGVNARNNRTSTAIQ